VKNAAGHEIILQANRFGKVSVLTSGTNDVG
jgi:hypothetical protein